MFRMSHHQLRQRLHLLFEAKRGLEGDGLTIPYSIRTEIERLETELRHRNLVVN